MCEGTWHGKALGIWRLGLKNYKKGSVLGASGVRGQWPAGLAVADLHNSGPSWISF